MQDRGIECTYTPCNCLVIGSVRDGEAYCSDFCRSVPEGGLESETCACGHPQCDAP